MKLRNKKTGEIVDTGKKTLQVNSDGRRFMVLDKVYESLAQLNEEWEDYKEPKEFYFIDQFMSVSKGVVDDVEYAGRHNAVNYAKKTSNNLKTAGNYFETREEAEKAVEKLKAWQRLKDKGFKFAGFSEGKINFKLDEEYSEFTYNGYDEGCEWYTNSEVDNDLNTLFGREE